MGVTSDQRDGIHTHRHKRTPTNIQIYTLYSFTLNTVGTSEQLLIKVLQSTTPLVIPTSVQIHSTHVSRYKSTATLV